MEPPRAEGEDARDCKAGSGEAVAGVPRLAGAPSLAFKPPKGPEARIGPRVPCLEGAAGPGRPLAMVLYFVGLGLADERDITVKYAASIATGLAFWHEEPVLMRMINHAGAWRS